MAGHRASRLRGQLLREISDIVRHLRDPRLGFVTVMDVEVSRDLGYATAFVSVIGDTSAQQEALAALHSAVGYIRRELAQRLTIRQVPELAIEYDNTSERAAHMSALINRLPADGEVGASPATGAEGVEPPEHG